MLVTAVEDLNIYDYAIIDNFLSEHACASLIEKITSLEAMQAFKRAKIGKKSQEIQEDSIRGDSIHWLDEDTEHLGISAYFDAIRQLVTHLNQSLYLGIQTFETHAAIYPPGTFYKKHIDQFKNTGTRRVSCVFYLNSDWSKHDGGELKLYTPEDEPLATITPSYNRLAIFLSHIPHEVLTTHKTRYSITGWLKIA